MKHLSGHFPVSGIKGIVTSQQRIKPGKCSAGNYLVPVFRIATCWLYCYLLPKGISFRKQLYLHFISTYFNPFL